MNPSTLQIAAALLLSLASPLAGCGLELHEKPELVDDVLYDGDAAESTDAKGDAPRTRGATFIPPTGAERSFAGLGGMRIPDNNSGGVTSRVRVPEAMRVSSVRVQLLIRHTYIGDLQVTLSHGGAERVLHNRAGGSTDNLDVTLAVPGFEGPDAQGDWTLRVVDNSAQDVGTIVRWTLLITPAAESSPPTAGRIFSGPGGIAIPDNDAAGIATSLVVPSNVTGRTVSVSLQVAHTYIGDLNVVLVHGNQSWVLHNHAGGSADSLSVNSALSPRLSGEPSGTWTLRVADAAAQDVGTLVSWSLIVSP